MSDAPDPQPPFEAARFRPAPLEGRGHLVDTDRFAALVEPGEGERDYAVVLPTG